MHITCLYNYETTGVPTASSSSDELLRWESDGRDDEAERSVNKGDGRSSLLLQGCAAVVLCNTVLSSGSTCDLATERIKHFEMTRKL